MQLSTKESGDFGAYYKMMECLAGREGCNARQGCVTAQEKVSGAGCFVYPPLLAVVNSSKRRAIKEIGTDVRGRRAESVETRLWNGRLC